MASGAAVLLAIIGGLAFLLIKRSGGSDGTFTVNGTLTINGFYPDQSIETCDGSSQPGYDDLTNGAQVVIYNHTNTAVATGSLSEGNIVPLNHDFNVCKMTFTVNGVPAGEGPYFVEVTHRGRITFDQADAGDVELSLG